MERETPRVETTEGSRPPAAPPRRPAAPPKKAKPKGVNVSDPVGDMLTRLRNAVTARKETVEIPASRLKADIARILKDQGYITGIEPGERSLVLRLKYQGKLSALRGVDRVSKPGRRVYAQKTEMPRVMGGLGIAIVSTSAGIMTGSEARKRGLGGEILAQVW